MKTTPKKRIYALSNGASQGKTTTVKRIADELHRLFPTAPITPGLTSLSEHEILITLTIKGVKIGITSQGDPGTGLYRRLEQLADSEKCDLLICTTRSRGETVRAILDIEKAFGFETVWFSNYQSENPLNHLYLNQKSALQVVELIRDMNGF